MLMMMMTVMNSAAAAASASVPSVGTWSLPLVPEVFGQGSWSSVLGCVHTVVRRHHVAHGKHWQTRHGLSLLRSSLDPRRSLQTRHTLLLLLNNPLIISAKWTGDILWCLILSSLHRVGKSICPITVLTEIYLTHAWKAKNISVRTIHHWKRHFRGFLATQSGSKSKWGLWRNVQKCQHRFRWIFPHTPALTPQHAGVIDDVIIIGRRRVYCASRLHY